MAVTINDVAKKAGVSKSTVSQYLNKRYHFMGNDTKLKIQQAIAELNYQPNQVARSLKQKKTNLIAIVASNLFSRFTIELVSAVEAEVSRLGYEVILSVTNDDPKKEKEYLQSFVARQVDGVIVFPTISNKDYYLELVSNNFPLVFVDRIIEDVPVDTVILDNYVAGKLACENLIEYHHKKIGLILFPLGEKDSITPRSQRLKGYKEALIENNIEVIENNIQIGPIGHIDSMIENLFYSEQAPTALIAGNDMILERILLWMKASSYKVPEDFSLVGIDDVSFARFFTPAITTVKQPVERMGAEAARLLLRKINNENRGSSDNGNLILRLIPKIITRESVNYPKGYALEE